MSALEFKKLPNGTRFAQGEHGKYALTLNTETKLWTVKHGTSLLDKGIKGFANAQVKAQAHNDAIAAETAKVETPAPVVTKARAKVKPATTKPEPEPAKVVATPAKKVRKFPEFEAWAEKNVTLKDVPSRGINKAKVEAENKKTLQVAKLRHGRERAKYNKENGVDATPATSPEKSSKVEKTPRVPKVKAERVKLSGEERFGPRWNNWGSVPSPLDFAMEQLNNKRGSRDQNILHGRKSPYSKGDSTVKNNYLQGCLSCYLAEQRVWEISQGTGLPKNFKFQYFNAKGVPTELVGTPPEGTEVLEGHVFGAFGKNKIGEGLKLPVRVK